MRSFYHVFSPSGKSHSLFKLILLTVVVLFNVGYLPAKIRIPQLFSDCMVLQRDTELDIWGWADENEKVTVRFRGQYFDAEPDDSGRWEVRLPAQSPGGPFVMEINEFVIRDVLVGDVWLFSGQSNQETPITRLVYRYPEINTSNNHNIRHFKVPTQESLSPASDLSDVKSKWVSGVASQVMQWTALAYFFAQEAYQHHNVPVGIIVSSKGGTAIESWIAQEGLADFPRWLIDKNALDSLRQIERRQCANTLSMLDVDGPDWTDIQVPGRWKDQGLQLRGTAYVAKTFTLPAHYDRKHAKLFLGTLVDSDSTFINSRFVGTTSYTYPPRVYDIPGGILREGRNEIVVKLTSNSGNGEFVADKTYKIIGDDLEIDLTGTWKYKVYKDLEEEKYLAEQLRNLRQTGSQLYNGMIYPIKDYKISGVVWYQGESNAGNPHEYKALLKSLINNWRSIWKQEELPFCIVQLPNFMEKRAEPSESSWARIREAQFETALEVPYTSLAVTYDVGEWNDIHPLNKKDMAKRLFLGARKLVFREKIVASGPLYQSMQIKGNKIILTFTETGKGLTCKGDELKHFAIAGEDKKFVWAKATIKGNKVIVSSPEVDKPVAVRYAWADNPEGANLYNKNGLLAPPFRTDTW